MFPLIRLSRLLPLLILIAAGVHARTPSGSLIVNTVNAAWSNVVGDHYSVSASATNTVSDFIDFSATSVTGQAFIGTVTTIPFALTNANNFSDRFRIMAVYNSGSGVGVSVHLDADGDGVVGPGEPALTETPPFAEGAVGRFLFAIDLPPDVPPGVTNVTILEITSFRTNTMQNSRLRITNRLISAAWSNRITPLSASDGIKSISDFSGSAFLDDAEIRITVRLDVPPHDTASVFLWYDAAADPDGPGSGNSADRAVPFIFDGQDWTAVVPAEDPALADGSLFRFILESDHVLYQPLSDPSWRFRIKSRPDQGSGFNVFPTVLDLSAQDALIMTYLVRTRSSVVIEIFDLKGELVRKFDEGSKQPGSYGPVYWDGKNHSGKEVAAGLYFVHLRAAGIDETRKVVIIK